MTTQKRYAVVCDCRELAFWGQSFSVGVYNTPEEAVRARVLHELWHKERFGDLGQVYDLPGHPDWRKSEKGRCDHAQAQCWADLPPGEEDLDYIPDWQT